MVYTVYYKKIDSFFWRKLKKVKGDGMIDEMSGGKTRNSSRWFIFDNEVRLEMDTKNMMFKFSKERYYLIREQMSKEAGHKI